MGCSQSDMERRRIWTHYSQLQPIDCILAGLGTDRMGLEASFCEAAANVATGCDTFNA